LAPAGQDDGTALVAGGSGWVGGWLDVGPGLDVAAGLAALAACCAAARRRPRRRRRRRGARGSIAARQPAMHTRIRSQQVVAAGACCWLLLWYEYRKSALNQ
jgi:hypothetical protein